MDLRRAAYRCHWRAAAVVVTLTDAERLHALYHLALQGPQGPGGDRGPIVHAYAMGHAKSRIPPDAAIDGSAKSERVVLH